MRQQSQAQAQTREALAQARQETRDAVAQARESARDAAEQARSIARDARERADAQAPARAPGTIIIPTGDGGEPVSISVDGKGIHVSQDGTETVIPIHDVVPRGAVQIVYSLSAMMVLCVIGFPIARAFSRWLDRRGTVQRGSAALSADVQSRLDAMERNIDTVALEMERVSEGQRFTQKLLTERMQAPAPEFMAASPALAEPPRAER